MRPYSPGGTLTALARAPEGSIPPTPSVHSLGRGLPEYLIRFAPHAFAPQRQGWPRRPPCHWCSSGSLRISPLHPEFHLPLPPSSLKVSADLSGLGPEISQPTLKTAYALFTPNKSGQRSPPTYYRGCWHVVSRGLFARYRHYLPWQMRFTTQGPSSLTRRRWFRVSPIDQDPPLLPPVGVWAVSQSQSGWPSSQTSYPS